MVLQKITTILVVEDNLDDLTLLDEEFKKAPGDFHLQMRVVYDGVQAKDYLEGVGNYSDRQRYPVPDIIILDLKMPRWTGFDFLEWLQTFQFPDGKIVHKITASGSTLESDINRAYALGTSAYMQKPLKWDDFYACVKKLNLVS